MALTGGFVAWPVAAQRDPMGTSEAFDPVHAAKRLVREARTGALASLTADCAPYASLVTVATSADNSPLLLLSRLARHSENIRHDPRVSLLIGLA